MIDVSCCHGENRKGGVATERHSLSLSLPSNLTKLSEELAQLFGSPKPTISLLRVGALVQQGFEPPLSGHVGGGVVQQAARGASPLGVPGQKVLTDGVIVVVDCDA